MEMLFLAISVRLHHLALELAINSMAFLEKPYPKF
jgi:hypothetical protein